MSSVFFFATGADSTGAGGVEGWSSRSKKSFFVSHQIILQSEERIRTSNPKKIYTQETTRAFIGPPAKRNATAGRRWSDTEFWLCCFVIFKVGAHTSILNETYCFVIFQKGVLNHSPPPLHPQFPRIVFMICDLSLSPWTDWLLPAVVKSPGQNHFIWTPWYRTRNHRLHTQSTKGSGYPANPHSFVSVFTAHTQIVLKGMYDRSGRTFFLPLAPLYSYTWMLSGWLICGKNPNLMNWLKPSQHGYGPPTASQRNAMTSRQMLVLICVTSKVV